MTSPDPGSLPLDGITILDLTDEATVFGARLLADLGARVVRVEQPGADPIRARGPFLDGIEDAEHSLAHLLYNGGKESVAIDLGSERGWRTVERFLPAVDAVIGPLDCSLGYDAIRQRRAEGRWPAAPGVVDVVFRRDAPGEVATDLIGTAAGGLLVLNGFGDDPPNYPAGSLAYKQASLAAGEAALALVLEGQRTGHAGEVTVSLQEAVTFTTLQTANANIWHWRGRAPSRHTPISSGTTFTSGDGKWVSFTIHPPNWPRFVEWVRDVPGGEALAAPEWDDATFRALNNAAVVEVIHTLCDRHTRAEMIEAGQARGLLVLPVHSVPEIAGDPHLLARGFFHEVWHPQLGRSVPVPRSPFLSPSWETAPRPAPELGASTEAVLRELGGLSQREIDELFAAGIVSGRRASPTLAAPRVVRTAVVTAAPSAPRQPLTGVRIVDFTWAIAGSLGTRLLADLGADVIKVESEYRLDPIRYIGPQPEGEHSLNTNGVFNDCSINKRAMTLNLNTSQGLALARDLARTADLVTCNYTPDRMAKWGLGYEDLRALKPDVIMLNMAVMGISGPNKDWRSYGSGIVAMCGLADLTGFPGRRPIGLGTLHTDFTVPYFAALYAMAALHRKQQTGEGCFLELSQYESSVHLLDTELIGYMTNGSVPERRGNSHPRLSPHGVYPALGDDRWLAVACRDSTDFERLCRVIGRDDLAAPQDVEARRVAESEVNEAITAWTSRHEAWEAAALLQSAGVPASPVEDLCDLMTSDAGMAPYFAPLQFTDQTDGRVQNEPIVWDGHRLPLRRAPHWNEHTREILQGELGLSDDEIAALTAEQVLF